LVATVSIIPFNVASRFLIFSIYITWSSSAWEGDCMLANFSFL
jgi:hypothetical protein